MDDNSKYSSFEMGGLLFEYDENKNRINIEKHGISFKSAARVFFDYDRIEYYDEENSKIENRYDVIGDLSAGNVGMYNKSETTIGNLDADDVVFVVYTERVKKIEKDVEKEIIRIISARYATNFERGLYYGKYWEYD